MIRITKYKKITSFIVVFALVICLGGVFLSTKAKAEVAQEYKSPDLTFVQIDSGDTYKSNFSQENFKQDENKYTLSTNSAYAWYAADSIDYAYKPVQFNYKSDDEPVMTVEVTLDSWSAYANTASAGIMLRSSLDPTAEMVFVHARPEAMLTIYRMTKATNAVTGTYGVTPVYPLSLKLVLSNKKITTMYKFANSANWITMSKGILFNYSKDIYVGLAAHTSTANDFATAKFQDFNITVEANEGYSFEETSSDGSESSTSSKEEIVLPEDSTPTDDVLLRETFTDNSMFDGDASVTNPIWSTNAASTNIVTTSDHTDRYLSLSYLDSGYYFAGDDSWTDFSTTMKVMFPTDVLLEQENKFTVFTRFNNNAMHGFHYYGVTFNSAKGKRTATLGYTNMASSIPDKHYLNALQTIDFDYLEDLGEEHTLRIDAFDNKITVYWDDQCLFDYTDNLGDGRIDVISKGCIGFKTTNASVCIDDITVKKLYDPVGGDYDNHIGGNWNDPIPDYIDMYDKNGWAY